MAATSVIAVVIVVGFLCTAVFRCDAAPIVAPSPVAEKEQAVSSTQVSDSTAKSGTVHESLFPNAGRSLVFSHFTWGIDLGTSIDLHGTNLSTIDLDVMVGYKSTFIRTLGVGSGVHRAFGQHNTIYPVYAVFRSSFRNKPSLLFFNTRIGYAFTTLNSGATRGGVMAAVGMGVNLAMSKKFQSHILLSYCYYHINATTRKESGLNKHYIDLARISFGVNF